MEKNYFQQLNEINVNDKTEKKNNLTYLSWAWAWGEVKKLFPEATYTIYENKDGWFYHTDGKTAWVKTGVTINGIEHIEYLPVMDFRNASITIEKLTSFDVNKAIQRSLTKAVARHGLGLYIYAGEDLPESETPDDKPTPKPPYTPKPDKTPTKSLEEINKEMDKKYPVEDGIQTSGKLPEKKVEPNTGEVVFPNAEKKDGITSATLGIVMDKLRTLPSDRALGFNKWVEATFKKKDLWALSEEEGKRALATLESVIKSLAK